MVNQNDDDKLLNIVYELKSTKKGQYYESIERLCEEKLSWSKAKCIGILEHCTKENILSRVQNNGKIRKISYRITKTREMIVHTNNSDDDNSPNNASYRNTDTINFTESPLEDLQDDFTSFKKFITEDLFTVKRELKIITDRFIAVEKGYCNQNQNNSTWGIHENTNIDFNIRILQEKKLLLQNTNSLFRY